MGLLDPTRENVGLAFFMLTLYSGALCLSVSHLREPLALPPPGFYLVTCVALFLYVGYQLGWGSTYQLWGNVTAAVILFSALIVVSAFLPTPPYSGGIRLPAVSSFLVTGAPLAVYLSFYCARRIARKRTQKRTINSP